MNGPLRPKRDAAGLCSAAAASTLLIHAAVGHIGSFPVLGRLPADQLTDLVYQGTAAEFS